MALTVWDELCEIDENLYTHIRFALMRVYAFSPELFRPVKTKDEFVKVLCDNIDGAGFSTEARGSWDKLSRAGKRAICLSVRLSVGAV